MAAAFALIGIWPFVHEHSPRLWALLLACGFLLGALLAPSLLRRLNLLWMRLGLLLQMIVTPLVMGVVFFGVLTPMSLILRGLGRDPLRLKWQSDANTYWMERQPAGPDPQTMRRQF
jgi:hypothetical protein